jgi:hypothetical protein
MTIYLATTADGKHTEGLGVMAQSQMACYAASRKLGINYAFFGFKNLTHYQYFDITQQKFCDDINHFFSFPNEFLNKEDYEILNFEKIDEQFLNHIQILNPDEDFVCFISPGGMTSFLQENINLIESNCWIKDLRKNIKLKDSVCDENKLILAVHLRKFTQTDCDTNPIRDYFNESKKNKIISLIEKICSIKNNAVEVHVHSQGDELKNFANEFKHRDIHLHLDEYPIYSLNNMINSDILVAANSSFSYIAHLYGKPITLIRDNFYHKTYNKTTILFDNEYNFDMELLVKKLEEK